MAKQLTTKKLNTLRSEYARWNKKEIPPHSFWDAVDAVCEEIGEAELNENLGDNWLHYCEPAADMMKSRFLRLHVPEGEQPTSMPHPDVLNAIDRLLNAIPKDWPPIEKVQTLDKQKVGHRQIATMHGITLDQLQMILDGEMEYPKGHITPHVQEQTRTKRRMRARVRMAYRAYQAEVTAESILTPESMLDDGYDAAQIAEEFGVDVEDVAEEAVRLGFDEATIDDLDEAIYSMADQGATTADIAAQLGVSVQKVAAIIRNRHKDHDKAAEERRKRDKLKRAKAGAK